MRSRMGWVHTKSTPLWRVAVQLSDLHAGRKSNQRNLDVNRFLVGLYVSILQGVLRSVETNS